MLVYLHAYTGFYFAIRSGNWGLRIATLKILNELILNELFFAYSRDNYEVLNINALADSYTYPDEVLEALKNGEWTVSVKGRPYHSLALDEAQECIINRKLKQITTRPSHFRMVELADFMAYLDTVTSGLEAHAFKYHKTYQQSKSVDSSRATLLYNLIKQLNGVPRTQTSRLLLSYYQ